MKTLSDNLFLVSYGWEYSLYYTRDRMMKTEKNKGKGSLFSEIHIIWLE